MKIGYFFEVLFSINTNTTLSHMISFYGVTTVICSVIFYIVILQMLLIILNFWKKVTNVKYVKAIGYTIKAIKFVMFALILAISILIVIMYYNFYFEESIINNLVSIFSKEKGLTYDYYFKSEYFEVVTYDHILLILDCLIIAYAVIFRLFIMLSNKQWPPLVKIVVLYFSAWIIRYFVYYVLHPSKIHHVENGYRLSEIFIMYNEVIYLSFYCILVFFASWVLHDMLIYMSKQDRYIKLIYLSRNFNITNSWFSVKFKGILFFEIFLYYLKIIITVCLFNIAHAMMFINTHILSYDYYLYLLQ